MEWEGGKRRGNKMRRNGMWVMEVKERGKGRGGLLISKEASTITKCICTAYCIMYIVYRPIQERVEWANSRPLLDILMFLIFNTFLMCNYDNKYFLHTLGDYADFSIHNSTDQ